MEILEKIIASKATNLPDLNLDREHLMSLYSVYPFNRFEYAISHLLARGIMSEEEYADMRESYHARNKYLHLFQMTAPRQFGRWAEDHITELAPELVRAGKGRDAAYQGEYDLYCEGVRVEVKASRAVDDARDVPLVEKALGTDSAAPFRMNFQQLKPDCCDVLICVGVWRDKILYWVLSSEEVRRHHAFSPGQHRGNTGEGQLWITRETMGDFAPYLTPARDLTEAVLRRGRHSAPD